jgi:hypothetical protein
MYELLCCGQNLHFQFLSRRRKTPSLLFVHIEAFFIKDEAPPYTMKSSLRRSIFVFTEAFCHHSEASLFFFFLLKPVLHVMMMMMILRFSNECLYECKNDVMSHANVCHRHKQNHTQTLHPLRNDFGVSSPFT